MVPPAALGATAFARVPGTGCASSSAGGGGGPARLSPRLSHRCTAAGVRGPLPESQRQGEGPGGGGERTGGAPRWPGGRAQTQAPQTSRSPAGPGRPWWGTRLVLLVSLLVEGPRPGPPKTNQGEAETRAVRTRAQGVQSWKPTVLHQEGRPRQLGSKGTVLTSPARRDWAGSLKLPGWKGQSGSASGYAGEKPRLRRPAPGISPGAGRPTA